ncbi:MAG: prolyl oligopeptidase family serine peptidase [Chitinophagia bacterium]
MKRIVLFFLLLGATALQAQKMADYLAPAFPSNLVANHKGEAIAWVFNNKGSRNIYYGQPDKNNFVAVTHYEGDDGVEMNSLVFAANDEKIYFVRGNSSNTKGEPANPAQLQYTTEENIYSVDLATQAIKKISKGAAPEISPDGKWLVYLQGGKAWKINLKEENAIPQPLFLSRGAIGSLKFNASGSQVLFVSYREEHSFIGVYDLASNKINFMDASTYLDTDPVWNSSGTHIAFVRNVNIKNQILFSPKRAVPQPWEIRVVEVATNKATTLFKADAGVGSIFTNDLPAVATQIIWNNDNYIVFPWEKTGWVHLYSIQVDSKKINHLTPGIGEVETMHLGNDGKSIYYVTNITDSNRRHIWKVDPAKNNATLLTKGNKIEYSPVVINSGLVYLQASATRPAWPMYLKQGAEQMITAQLFPSNFPTNLVTPKTILVKATDQFLAPAQLFLPVNYDATKKYPAIIFLHGGSRRQMLEGFNYSSYYSNAYAVNEYFASQGYIVMALNYRSGIGYGLNFREALNYGMTGGSEVNDLIGAGEYLKSRADVNGAKIGLWGGSYGGYLTAHGLSKRSDLFAAGVDIHGVHNWNDEEPTFTPWYDSLRFPIVAQVAYKASPVYSAKGWKSPVLFIHGDDDRNVPFTETIHMIQQLRTQNVSVEEMILPDEIHGFLLYKSWLKVDEAAFEFINRKFKK